MSKPFLLPDLVLSHEGSFEVIACILAGHRSASIKCVVRARRWGVQAVRAVGSDGGGSLDGDAAYCRWGDKCARVEGVRTFDLQRNRKTMMRIQRSKSWHEDYVYRKIKLWDRKAESYARYRVRAEEPGLLITRGCVARPRCATDIIIRYF